MRSQLGWIPDSPNPFDWNFVGSKVASLRALTGADIIDYRPFDTPRTQIYNSCVGHAISGAAALCMAIAKTPITFPSAQFAYTGARILAQSPEGIVDIGSSPRLAMTWLRDHGMVAEERWPETAANVNTIPPLDAWQEGECATVEAFYRIDGGDGASALVGYALRRGYCPAFAMMVDTKYEGIGRNVYDGPGGATIGGHMQCVVGVIEPLDVFVIRNTWGPSWGDLGYGYMSRRVFDMMARDIWVVQAAPEVH